MNQATQQPRQASSSIPNGALVGAVCRSLRLSLLAAALFWPATANADLQDDVERLLVRVNKATAYHLGPRFLEQGDELPLLLPPSIATNNDSVRNCIHIVVIGAQSIHFSCDAASASGPKESRTPVASRAGLVELVRCGAARGQLSDVVVTMLSLRGPLDAIAFTSRLDRPVAAVVVPNRSVGLETPERKLTRESEVPHLEAWLQSAEAEALMRGATRTERHTLPAQDRELGETLIGFDPGCHEVRLLADVDWESLDESEPGADLTWQDSNEIAARDTLHTRSPTLRVCTAQPKVAIFRFPTLPQSTAGVLFRAHFGWPLGIPVHWALPVRNRIAQALLQRNMTSLTAAPIRAWMGGATLVTVHVPLRKNACFVAIVATTELVAGSVSLEVMSGTRWSTDSSLDGSAASLALCQVQANTATLAVNARDAKSTWILGLWEISTFPSSSDLQ
jgi:hypothetical protein